jgi:hypothetical protein
MIPNNFFCIWSIPRQNEFYNHLYGEKCICLLIYLLIFLLTYSIEQSSSQESNWFLASQTIHRNLWNPNVHYRIHKCPPTVPTLNQTDPVHVPTIYLLKFRRITILPSRLGYSSWMISLGFTSKTMYRPFLHL